MQSRVILGLAWMGSSIQVILDIMMFRHFQKRLYKGLFERSGISYGNELMLLTSTQW